MRIVFLACKSLEWDLIFYGKGKSCKQESARKLALLVQVAIIQTCWKISIVKNQKNKVSILSIFVINRVMFFHYSCEVF